MVHTQFFRYLHDLRETTFYMAAKRAERKKNYHVYIWMYVLDLLPSKTIKLIERTPN